MCKSLAKSSQVGSNILFEKFLPQRVLLWLKSPCCKSVRVAHEEAIVHVGLLSRSLSTRLPKRTQN